MMKINLWNIMVAIFYYSTLFVTVWYITQFNWGELSSLQVIEKCGIIGGLMYLGEFFRKETKDDALHAVSETKENR